MTLQALTPPLTLTLPNQNSSSVQECKPGSKEMNSNVILSVIQYIKLINAQQCNNGHIVSLRQIKPVLVTKGLHLLMHLIMDQRK